ncbi:response regulator, partial [Nitrospira sp. BLG_2]|uniref:ATP-binding response regulator n=1 Tax=Nitrospira sp. BLG_2 TaxID=3397507 RepID=UPI003B9DBE74
TVTVPEAMELMIPEDQAVLLFQSVRELLMNAWKHAGTGKAAVVLTYTDDQLRITVSDKGAGFDLVTVAAAHPTSGGVSSKFGLFSIEERMQSLGGSFELESAKGKGTTATLTLPLARHRETEVKVQAESPERSFSSTLASILQPPASRIRVLLVDDHTMVRQGLRAMLESYEDVQIVGEAVDGQDALRLAEKLRPGIVVMDINMPRMNGIETTREMTARYPDVMVIGLSVNAGDDNRGAMIKAGAVRLMTKESAVEELYGTIQEAVKRK